MSDSNGLDVREINTVKHAQAGLEGFHIHGNPAAIFGALAKAQAAFLKVERTKLVKVRSEKGNYDFWYAPLENVLGAVEAALNANELALMQPFCKEANSWVLRTILGHSSGAYVECTMTLPPGDSWQKLGSAITYARRYMVGSLLGIAPEEDDDGTGAEDMPRETQTRKPEARQNSQATPPKPATKPPPATEAAPQAPKGQAEANPNGGAPSDKDRGTSPSGAASVAPATKDQIARIGSGTRSRQYVKADGEVVKFTQELVNIFAVNTIRKPALVEVNGAKQFNSEITAAEADSLLAALAQLPAVS